MFRAALSKLTLLYLLIIMAISFFFSLSIYRTSTLEITNNLGRQQNVFERLGRGGPMMQSPDFLAEQERLAADSRQNIIINLLYTNAIILIIGGGLSYFLAGITLKPIEESHEAQSRFTSDASHELRSPLAAMKTEIEVALRNPKLTREEAVALLGSNLEEVERLSALSDGLLALTRDNGESIEKTNFDLSETINASIALVGKKVKERRAKIELDLDPKIKVHADPNTIQELLVILLDNALIYSSSNITIDVGTSSKDRFATIKVTDNGIGIAKDDLEKIFDRFYRVDQSRTKNEIPGYGLGLALAKKITETNGGSIRAESKLGAGSTFTVKLPLARA